MTDAQYGTGALARLTVPPSRCARPVTSAQRAASAKRAAMNDMRGVQGLTLSLRRALSSTLRSRNCC
jgi:hypothetical protein